MNLSDIKPIKQLQDFAEGLRLDAFNAEAQEFAPGILRVQHRPPAPLPRLVLYGLLALFGIALLWVAFGRLDIVAVAQGKLVPQTYVKIVQPADSGIVQEILVNEGQQVAAGQVLMRMDTKLSEADTKALGAEFKRKALTLRRIDAELAGSPLTMQADDSADLYRQIEAQYRANRQAYLDALSQEQATLAKARQELAAAQEIRSKLERTLPTYKAQEEAWDKLAKDGFAGKLIAADRSRERVEKEQDLLAQTHTVASLQSTIAQSEQRLAQITSGYRSQLQKERVDTYGDYQKLEQEWAKQSHRNQLLELKASQAGIIKDLATHTPGTVVSPGTVLMTLVPQDEQLQAEVWVENEDAGFVRPQQPTKIKILAYQFQKYGMVDGTVTHISADASDANRAANAEPNGQDKGAPAKYRALVALKAQALSADGEHFKFTPGMQVSAEVKLGTRTILEYLLSPVQKAFHEAGRER
jgi:HlyD family secretion protein